MTTLAKRSADLSTTETEVLRPQRPVRAREFLPPSYPTHVNGRPVPGMAPSDWVNNPHAYIAAALAGAVVGLGLFTLMYGTMLPTLLLAAGCAIAAALIGLEGIRRKYRHEVFPEAGAQHWAIFGTVIGAVSTPIVLGLIGMMLR